MTDTTLNRHSPDLLLTAAACGTVPAAVPRTVTFAAVLFTATAFTASALLFVVEPMYARLLLPKLGGSPSVWNACVLFFQAMLLLGYLYAHLSTRWLGVRWQATLHALVLALPLLFLPVGIGSSAPAAGEDPVWWLLQRMALTLGVPFFVLATSAPLLQRWFAALPHPASRDPYFLYAAGNLGSLLALLGYPFLIEPSLGLVTQAQLWTRGYLAFGGAVAVCIWLVRRHALSEAEGRVADEVVAPAPIPLRQRLSWIVLSFAPSSLMLGVTAHISTDVAAVPLMWVLPLALYLLTFVIAFSSYATHLGRCNVLAAPLVLACLAGIILNGNAWWVMPLHLITFFVCALACHGRLAEARPPVKHLTAFYLCTSFGGMLGGVFNTLVAPQVFSTVLEYPLVLALICALIPLQRSARTNPTVVAAGYIVLVLFSAAWVWGSPSDAAARLILAAGLGLSVSLATTYGAGVFRACAMAALAVIVIGSPMSQATVLFTGRSFFGVMRVMEASDHTYRTLRHGTTQHGWQQLPADGACAPSSYYHPQGPVGDIVKAAGPRLAEVAVVGLGTGAMACYAAPGQRWTFYEIDPLVERIARDPALFTHMRDARGNVSVVIGDGRIRLQELRPGQHDMIVLDAFSSDGIPVHLLTREAVQLYMTRLKEDGILAIHISNRYLELEPVVATIAREERLGAWTRADGFIPMAERRQGRTAAHWVVLSRGSDAARTLAGFPDWRAARRSNLGVWTDDYSNIFSVVR